MALPHPCRRNRRGHAMVKPRQDQDRAMAEPSTQPNELPRLSQLSHINSNPNPNKGDRCKHSEAPTQPQRMQRANSIHCYCRASATRDCIQPFAIFARPHESYPSYAKSARSCLTMKLKLLSLASIDTLASQLTAFMRCSRTASSSSGVSCNFWSILPRDIFSLP